MNSRLIGLTLGLMIISGGLRADVPCEQAALLQDLGLRYVSKTKIDTACANYDNVVRLFSAVKYASVAALFGSAATSLYNWYSGITSRTDRERISALEESLKNLGKQAPEKPVADASKGWLSSVATFGKGVFAGVPTAIGSTLVSGAALGLLTNMIPVSDLAKSEPSYKWFVGYKTGFVNECNLLMIYYQQQVVHDAFCVETLRLVIDVEKILGYVAYQIKKIKKTSSMAASVLSTRSEQLRVMTNKIVDYVAEKNYDKMVESLQLLSVFVNDGIPAGIFA